MVVEKSGFDYVNIYDISQEEIEVIQAAVLRIIEDLPTDEQPTFRRMAMDIDKLIKR